MSATTKRRWAELAPFRESVLVHFTRPGLRRRLQDACEKLVEEALELEEGRGFGESWLEAGASAVAADLWHAQGTLQQLAATRLVSEVTEEEERLCQVLEDLAKDLERTVIGLDRQSASRLRSTPPAPRDGL